MKGGDKVFNYLSPPFYFIHHTLYFMLHIAHPSLLHPEALVLTILPK